MSENLKQLLADLAVKQGEAKNLIAKPGAITAEINAKADEIEAIQAKIEVQKQIDGANPSESLTDEAADANGETHTANVAAFKNLFPNLLSHIENDARTAERQRIQEIDAIAGQVNASLLNKAKYTAPMTAKDLAFEQMKDQQKSGSKFLKDFAADTGSSGVDGVGAAVSDLPGTTEDQQRVSFGDKVAKAANKLMGR
jgi:hypothetical protein